MPQLRVVDTPAGQLTYTLVHKRVKNLNLRVGQGGGITMSVPMRCTAERADQFLREKADWLFRAVERRRENGAELLPAVSQPECARLLNEALDRVYPLVAPYGVGYPKLKLRALKSQWGNCHWDRGYITLNTALSRCPEHLRDYVALHELVHVLYHDHGAGFYQMMDRLMPDWRERRRELKRYGAAAEQTKE